ncbi:MAG TPA: DUF1697 domain-containing protein, partial [Acidimicrobiales bacterium]|nr:DUF1697 domain-containing protein [Acidimicrobiales bacterium]
MRTHVALLRGINVGGNNKVAMADLRQLFSSLGHEEVATYIQSGNVVFSARPEGIPAAELQSAIESEIEARTGVACAVVVLSAGELSEVISSNPFPEPGDH